MMGSLPCRPFLRPGAIDAAVYLVVGLVTTWPLPLHLSTHAAGSDRWGDQVIFFETPVNIWNLWWFRFAIVDLQQSPFNGTHTFYPIGADLWYHTLAPAPAVVGALLQSLFTPVVTYNLLTLAALLAAGVSAAALGRYTGLSAVSARLAGAIYTFSPALLGRVYAGHFELLWVAWIPLALLLVFRTLDAPRVTPTVLLGLSIAGAAYTSAYYAVYAVQALTLAALVRWRQVFRLRTFASLVAASFVALACTSPMLLRLAAGESRIATTASLRADFRDLSVEPLAFVVPSFMHPVLGDYFRVTIGELAGPRALPQEATAYLGWTVLVLAILGTIGTQRSSRLSRAPHPRVGFAVAITVVFLVLALGSELKWRGRSTGVPLPATALMEVPVVRLARAPGRHIYVAMLGVALLAAAGLERVPRRGVQAALVAIIAFEYWPTVPMTGMVVPEVYHRLSHAPDGIAVMDVPVGARDGQRVVGRPSSFNLLAQTVHQKPIIAGMASRLTDDRWASVIDAPLVGALMGERDGASLTSAEVTAHFRRHRIAAIVVHPDADDAERALIERLLPIRAREPFADGFELWWVE